MDGAFGTVLHGRGVPIDQSFDAVNLTNPALVAEIHRGYIDAGSDLIETNTFGANRFKLMEHGQQQQVEAINRAAVAIARRVIAGSFREVLLAGSIGPLGVRLAPLGRVTVAEAEAAFGEQIAALVGGAAGESDQPGIDLLIIETMSDIKEVEAQIRARAALTEVDATNAERIRQASTLMLLNNEMGKRLKAFEKSMERESSGRER